MNFDPYIRLFVCDVLHSAEVLPSSNSGRGLTSNTMSSSSQEVLNSTSFHKSFLLSPSADDNISDMCAKEHCKARAKEILKGVFN
jgi:hypothetical protein